MFITEPCNTISDFFKYEYTFNIQTNRNVLMQCDRPFLEMVCVEGNHLDTSFYATKTINKFQF